MAGRGKRQAQGLVYTVPRSSLLTRVLGDSFQESEDDSDQTSCDRSPRGYKRARTSPLETRKGVNHGHVRYKNRSDRIRQLNREHQQRQFAECLGFAFVPPGLSSCFVL